METRLSDRLHCCARAASIGVAGFFCIALSNIASSERFPVHPIRLITAGAPGSVPDMVARPLAESLARELLQPVVIENRPSAGGFAAINLAVKAPSDGYTIALVSKAQVVYNPYLFT